jgi:hypothetical protein
MLVESQQLGKMGERTKTRVRSWKMYAGAGRRWRNKRIASVAAPADRLQSEVRMQCFGLFGLECVHRPALGLLFLCYLLEIQQDFSGSRIRSPPMELFCLLPDPKSLKDHRYMTTRATDAEQLVGLAYLSITGQEPFPLGRVVFPVSDSSSRFTSSRFTSPSRLSGRPVTTTRFPSTPYRALPIVHATATSRAIVRKKEEAKVTDSLPFQVEPRSLLDHDSTLILGPLPLSLSPSPRRLRLARSTDQPLVPGRTYSI